LGSLAGSACFPAFRQVPFTLSVAADEIYSHLTTILDKPVQTLLAENVDFMI